jgi:mRNA-degrading endonuclease RelE of RelBE toxin-antitoxin system
VARVQLTDEAVEDLADLDGSTRRAVFKALKKLQTEPEQRGVPLGHRSGGNLTTFRLRLHTTTAAQEFVTVLDELWDRQG